MTKSSSADVPLDVVANLIHDIKLRLGKLSILYVPNSFHHKRFSSFCFRFSKIEGSYIITTHAVKVFKEIISKSEWKTAE